MQIGLTEGNLGSISLSTVPFTWTEEHVDYLRLQNKITSFYMGLEPSVSPELSYKGVFRQLL